MNMKALINCLLPKQNNLLDFYKIKLIRIDVINLGQGFSDLYEQATAYTASYSYVKIY